MKNEEQEKLKKNNRTEEVQEIIERMPVNFGLWVTMIVIVLFIFLFVFGWLIRYPDVVTGNVTINGNEVPVKLVTFSSGKLRLNELKSMAEVKQGQIIGYIENSAEISSVYKLDSLLKYYNPINGFRELLVKLPKDMSFGELNSKYSVFINSLNELKSYESDKLIEKQIANFSALLNEQQNAINASINRININQKNLDYFHKFYKRDSVLFKLKVISETEFNKSEINYINSQDAHQNILSLLISNKQYAQQTIGKIRELEIQRLEKETLLKTAMIAAYNDLLDNIKSWKLKYVLQAPFDGKVQFLKFWSNNQFVQNGEPIFTVIPMFNKIRGEVYVPSNGVGKVEIGQEVIVKLENFPFREFGTIKGVVNSISMSSNTNRTEIGDVENYLVTVDFPEGLVTNFGPQLKVQSDMKGIAEIITNDRKLIQRLYENINYALKK